MNISAKERRKRILDILKNADSPITAKGLAAVFSVSRQIIVQDLAVIRASVTGIISTNRGYVFNTDRICTREYKVKHGEDRVADELNLIVDCGGIVRNVSISHRVYGRITAEMDIRSRQDVNEFLESFDNSQSSLLGNATSGYHYHLVEAVNEERLNLIEQKLKEAGFLAPLLPWEQEQ